jgi:hypothetical protein
MTQETLHRPGGSLAKGTDSLAFDLPGGTQQQVQIFLASLTFFNALDNALHPAGAFTTGRTLPAGLGVVES